MTKSDDNGNTAGGATLTVLTIAYNHATCLVSCGMRDVGIALAQMMLHEASLQLDIMRRQAAAMELRQQLADKANADALARSIFSKG